MAFLKRGAHRMWAWLEKVAVNPRQVLLINIALGAMIAALTIVFIGYTHSTHQALCGFRDDLAARADASRKFLDDHPDLKNIQFGPAIVPRSYLVNQVTAQKATLRSLDKNLDC